MSETITLTYGALSRSRTVPDGTGARIIAATKARLALDPSATNAQVFTALADEMFQNLKQNVVNYERQEAARAASNDVADIPLT